jgi:hypothetical protein
MPDMIENYMDYSAEDCQNSFTMDQMLFVRWVIRGFRPDIATLSFTGIDKIKKTDTFVLAPNPTNEIINLTAANGSIISTVKIYNTSGQQVYGVNCSNSRVTLNTLDLAEGIYFLELTSNQNIERLKFVVIH